MSDAKVTIEKVQDILEQLRSENIKPTFKIILNRIGGGSYATLHKLKDKFPEVFNELEFRKPKPALDSGLGQELVELKLENMRLKYESERRDLEMRVDELQRDKVQIEQRNESERRDLELRVETLQRDKVQIEQRGREAIDTLSNSNEALRMELDSALARIQELEGKMACDAHGIDNAGTYSKAENDTAQLSIETLGTQEKSAKARAIELHNEYPNMTQREIIERLFDEGHTTKSGKRLGSGQISKWLKQ